MEIEIKRFKAEYQKEVKDLIMEGLKKHWGTLAPAYNKDLNDINKTYSDDIFLTAWYEDKIIGTGAAIIRKENAQIVRMSVKSEFRRNGIGYKILNALIDNIKTRNINEIILETTKTWLEVITFYKNYGFEITHKEDDDIYFKLIL